MFDVKVDEARAAKSYETGLADSSVDLVFAFASAHHFVLHRKTFAELARILRPGGVALYLYEPSVRSWAYPLARGADAPHANRRLRRRTEPGADPGPVKAAGLTAEMDLWPTMIGRGPLGVLYNGAADRHPTAAARRLVHGELPVHEACSVRFAPDL